MQITEGIDNMSWILLGYGLSLIYIAIKHNIANKNLFLVSWIAFGLIPINHFIFTVLTFNNMQFMTVGIWSKGIDALLLGISLLVLGMAIIPGNNRKNES